MRSIALISLLFVFATVFASASQAVVVETFASGFGSWKPSSSEQFSGRWAIGKGPLSTANETGLILQDAAKKHAISTLFAAPLSGVSNDVVVQYEVRFHKKLECGGSYIKLLQASPSLSTESFSNETPYIIMFGPDICGMEQNKVHFIFRHQNPVSKEWEEKHLTDAPKIKSDTLTHLYTLVIRTDNSFEIFIDQTSARKGSLLDDFKPPVNPPNQIDDPSDSKPLDWVDEAKIPDPAATKPDDWDEDAPKTIVDSKATKPAGWLDDAPLKIPDPEAQKPEDWDDELDGAFEPPLVDNPACDRVGCGPWVPPKIPNPAFKGKWKAPMVDNPSFKGVWKPRQIPNPSFFVDNEPHKLHPMGGAGFELWTMQDSIEFNNIFIGKSEQEAIQFASNTWKPKFDAQVAADPSKRPMPSIVSDIWQWLQQNWVAVVATLVVTIISLVGLVLCCCKAPQTADSRPGEPSRPTQSITPGQGAKISQPQSDATSKPTTHVSEVVKPKSKPEPEPEPVPPVEPAEETVQPVKPIRKTPDRAAKHRPRKID